MVFIEIIKRTDKRILILLIFIFSGVGYSVYKAIDSLSESEKSPEYRRSPPGAFAIPATDTIVESNKLEDVYLPDSIYTEVKAETDNVMTKILQNSLRPADLTQYGLPVSSANNFTVQLRSLRPGSGTGEEIDPFFTVQANLPQVSVSRTIVNAGSLMFEFIFTYQINPDSSITLYSLKPA